MNLFQVYDEPHQMLNEKKIFERAGIEFEKKKFF